MTLGVLLSPWGLILVLVAIDGVIRRMTLCGESRLDSLIDGGLRRRLRKVL